MPEPLPRPQFTLKGMFALTAAFGVLFAILRALNLSPVASILVGALATLSIAAAFTLLVVIAKSLFESDQDD